MGCSAAGAGVPRCGQVPPRSALLRGGALKAASPPPLQQFSNGRYSLESTGATDVGRKRDHNEDKLGLLPEEMQQDASQRGYLFAVADGMGGAEKGEVASQMA